jgi:hypothetical protein
MMIKKFVIKVMFKIAKITEVEVIRETDVSVFVPTNRKEDYKGRREAKISQFDHYHDTWDLAHADLLDIAEKDVMRARRNLETAKAFYGNVKGMRKPDNAKETP